MNQIFRVNLWREETSARFNVRWRTLRNGPFDLPDNPFDACGGLDTDRPRDLGTALFKALFGDHPVARQLFEGACGELRGTDYCVLLITIPDTCGELRQWPWELLNDEMRADYLIDQRIVVVVAHRDEVADTPEKEQRPTRILLLHRNAAPAWAMLRWRKVLRDIREAVSRTAILFDDIDALLPRSLGAENANILHYHCHGTVINGEPVLVDRGRFGRSFTRLASDVVQDLARICNPPARLVVVGACRTGKGNAGLNEFRTFPGLLLKQGVSNHVVSVTGDIWEDAMHAFTQELYRCLAAGQGLARAMLAARAKAKELDHNGSINWALLRLTVQDSVGFYLAPPAPLKAPEPVRPADKVGPDLERLRTEAIRVQLLLGILKGDPKVRDPFKLAIADPVEASLRLVRSTLELRNAPRNVVRRLTRRCISEQMRIVRLLSFRMSPADNIARGITGGLVGCMLGFATVWLLDYWAVTSPSGLGNAVRAWYRQPAVSQPSAIALGLVPGNAPVLPRTATGAFHFLAEQASGQGKFVQALGISAALGALLGLTRAAVASLVGFRFPWVHIVCAAAVGVAAGQGLVRLSLDPSPARLMVSTATVLGGVAWIVSGLKTPTRTCRATRSLLIAVVCGVLVAAVNYLTLSGFGQLPPTITDLLIAHRAIWATLIIAVLGYSLSRS